MTAASEITDAREALTYQWEESRRALLATAKASRLAPEQYNAVLSAIHLMHAVVKEDIGDMLEAAASRLEAEEPGEDPRREHGTYYTANGMRAA